MINTRSLAWVFALASMTHLAGCGGDETTIIEKDSVAEEDRDLDDDHDHDHDGDVVIESEGRLVVLNGEGSEAVVYNLEDNTMLDSFALSTVPSAMTASADLRYAVLVDRAGDSVAFIDGGLWQEDHVEHLHDYEEAPVQLSYTLSGSRPTHVVPHEGQLAIFYDGDSETDTPASITVISDSDIASENAAPLAIDYSVNMHGVAEPRGDHLFASWRRDDADTTSANPILPDQIAVYHLHDEEYEQEEILDVTCPNLHGAAQNESYLAFGCSDGVVLIQEQDETFTTSKIDNPEEVEEGLRVGSLYGHEDAEQFIGLASAHGGSSVQWFSIDPEEGEMELIDWQPVEGASVVGRGFSFAAEQFLILDNQGYLTMLEPHDHDGHSHWEFSERILITEEDLANTPEEAGFSLAFSHSGHYAYVTDPIAQHVVIIDLEEKTIAGELELGFVPTALTWLGIAEAHDHE